MSKIKVQEGSNTILVISSMYRSMSRTDQKIADAVQQDPETVIYSTLTFLADKAGVSDASILRFCRKLGFSGFQHFKLSLAQELVTSVKSVHSEVEETDDLFTIADKITEENKVFLDHTLALLDIQELRKAIGAIKNAGRIYFIGVGSSANTAADAKYRFMRLGYKGELLVDSHLMAMEATLMNKGDVVFAVSTSGSAKDIVDAVKIAKKNGIFFICLTSHAKSPVTHYADAVLLSFSKETPLQGGAFNSKITQIHVLDILTTALSFEDKERVDRAIEITSKAVSDKLY